MLEILVQDKIYENHFVPKNSSILEEEKGNKENRILEN